MKLSALSLCAGLVVPITAHALDVDSIDINGFGSIIGSMTGDEDESIYGIDNDFSFQNESLFALQVGSRLSDKWSATAQVLARGQDSFDPTFEWAYLAYEATSNLKLFFGRQRFKLYKYSGFVDVGYAYPWLRLPQGVYSIPFSSGDGVGAAYQTYAGDLEVNLQYNVLGSTVDNYVPSTGGNEGTIDVQLSHILSLDMNYDAFNFGVNLSYVPELSYDIQSANEDVKSVLTQPGIAQLPAGIQSDINDLSNDDVSFFIWDVYGGWDNGDYFVLGEYSDQDFSESAFSDQTSWYLTAGFRMDRFTVHASYGQDENERSATVSDDVAQLAAALPEAARPGLLQLAGGLRAVEDAQVEDSSFYKLGVRYDFDAAVAFKGDITQVSDDDNPQREATIYAVGLDFVF